MESSRRIEPLYRAPRYRSGNQGRRRASGTSRISTPESPQDTRRTKSKDGSTVNLKHRPQNLSEKPRQVADLQRQIGNTSYGFSPRRLSEHRHFLYRMLSAGT